VSESNIPHQIARVGPPLKGQIEEQCGPKFEFIGELIEDIHARPGQMRRARLAVFTFVATVLSAGAAVVTIFLAFHR